MKQLLFLSALCTAWMACGTGTPKTTEENTPAMLTPLAWLAGSWQLETPEGNAVEVWKQENDSVFTGFSYFIAGGDTVSSEKLRLEQHGKDLFYIPTVSNQNNGQPVRFKLTSATANQFVFENPAHDFPQKITYLQKGADSLLAEIAGTEAGKAKAMQFPMKRVK